MATLPTPFRNLILQNSKEVGVGPGDLSGTFLVATHGQGFGPSRVPLPQCHLSKPWVYVSKPQ